MEETAWQEIIDDREFKPLHYFELSVVTRYLLKRAGFTCIQQMLDTDWTKPILSILNGNIDRNLKEIKDLFIPSLWKWDGTSYLKRQEGKD